MNQTTTFSNLEAEFSVIGAILIDNHAFEACENLPDDAFSGVQYRIIYKTIREMLAANMPVDVITLSDRLEAHGLLDTAGGLSLLIDIQQNTPSSVNIRRYVEVVQERYGTRRLFQAAEDINRIAGDFSCDLETRIADAEKAVLDISNRDEKRNEEHSYVDALRRSIDAKEEIIKLGDALIGFPTGLNKLNNLTRGLRRGSLSIIAARPAMGKSVLAEMIARSTAKAGYRVRFQSYEMTDIEITDRGAAAEMGISYANIKAARMTESEYILYEQFVNRACDWNITIDTEMLDVDKVVSRCRSMKRRTGLDMLVIDHLHLMPKRTDNTIRELDETTAKFKRLAMELDIHVLVVAQLSRNVESRADKRPGMADLRDSGGIEQNANLIILPYRDAYYFEDKDEREAELIIAKNRDGERQTLHVGWDGGHQRFTDEPDYSLPRNRLPNPEQAKEQGQRRL